MDQETRDRSWRTLPRPSSGRSSCRRFFARPANGDLQRSRTERGQPERPDLPERVDEDEPVELRPEPELPELPVLPDDLGAGDELTPPEERGCGELCGGGE